MFLEAFQGPLDLLLYLIRKQNFNILDIPLADVTRQYLAYVDQIRKTNLELASEYLLMAAMLIEIKSRMLLPPKKTEDEQIKLAAAKLDALPLLGRDFLRAQVTIEQSLAPRFPDVDADDGRVRIRQRPGPRNALGDIKFVFPNAEHIFLHHTPSVGLFEPRWWLFLQQSQRRD